MRGTAPLAHGEAASFATGYCEVCDHRSGEGPLLRLGPVLGVGGHPLGLLRLAQAPGVITRFKGRCAGRINTKVYTSSLNTFGSPLVHAELRDMGKVVGKGGSRGLCAFAGWLFGASAGSAPRQPSRTTSSR